MVSGRPSLRTVRAIFPHTALRSVGSRGLDETDVGFTQAREPAFPGWHRFLNLCGSATRGFARSSNPMNWHTDRASPLVPTCGTPTPIRGSLDESCSHWVLMHILELLFQFRRLVDLEGVVLRLPEAIALPEALEAVRSSVRASIPSHNAPPVRIPEISDNTILSTTT